MSFQPDDVMSEFGQYFNFDQATAPSHAQKGKTVVSPQFTAPGPENAYIPPSQPTFQGPSHQYELFKQHIPMVPGAFSSMQRTRQVPSQTYMPLHDMSDTDAASFGGMDMDFPDMLDGSSMSGYVDPSTVGAGSEAGDASPVAQPAQRLYPGMHQQHAAAEKQKKEQQRLQEQQRMVLAQQSLGAPVQSGHQRRPSQGRNQPADPVMEERISQILRTMRQANNRPTQSGTPQPVLTQPAKQRKDEEDMDEDERLLASEEGKKLSSKERRQLRNKVSARAFRSRRKEYISQLEGELQVKTSEADELQFDNEKLRAENTQLTDLAHMLLGHPAFNDVLEDMAARGSPIAALSAQTTQHRQSIPQSTQAPITVVPTASQPPTSNSMDFSAPMGNWNGVNAPDFNFNPNVFAVTKLPEPVLETNILGSKAEDFPVAPIMYNDIAKTDYPVIERPSSKTDYPVMHSQTDSELDDLYAAPTSSSIESPAASLSRTRGDSTIPDLSSKSASQQIELVSVEQSKDEEQALEARFTSLCGRLDAMCLRLESMIPGA